MTSELLKNIPHSDDTLREFFLPADGPSFCVGCNSCFMKGAEHCPGAEKMLPIAEAFDWADIIILDSPNYVMEMSGAMKNMLDHLAYRWVTHRPSEAMFHKVAITCCSSAGAPAGHTTKSMARQLKWMCVSNVYTFPFICNALGALSLKPKKRAEMEQKAKKIAVKAVKCAKNPKVSLRTKMFFNIFGKMQSSPDAAWNPTDRDWWVNNGWTKGVKPWKKV